MDQALLKPLKGVLVRDPVNNTPLSEKGEIKPMSGKKGQYWRRRLKDGSVFIVSENKPEEKTEKKQSNKPTFSNKYKTGGQK